jgi:hypothetical protein
MMDDARPIPPLERHYGALATYLAAQRGLGLAQCTLSFDAIETVVGRPLPRTARHPRRYRPWWYGYGAGFPHAWYGWQRAGWTVAAVDLAAETVMFARGNADG